jgi:hypothetical protein
MTAGLEGVEVVRVSHLVSMDSGVGCAHIVTHDTRPDS